MLFFWTCLLTVATANLVQAEINDTVDGCGSLTSYLEVADQMTMRAKTCANDKAVKEGSAAPSGFVPTDCTDVLRSGRTKSGFYNVWSTRRNLKERPLLVYCDMDTDGGGWTVIQRRGNFGNPADYFYRDWNNYKNGFGDIKEDFWLGNDAVHALSTQRKTSIRFDLESVDGTKVYAQYANFYIEDEGKKYRLHVSGYTGNAGDSFTEHNNMSFTTKDQKNDISNEKPNCAVVNKGAWWYRACYQSNLNGLYLPGKYGGKGVRYGDRVTWYAFKGNWEALKATVMKLRPRDFKKL